MKLSGFICHDDYLAKTAKLSDEEVGRLFRALMKYHATGEEIEITGREWLAFDFIKEDIDQAEQRHDEKCKQNQKNKLEALEKAKQQETNVNERQRSTTNDNERKRSTPYKEKEKEYEKENEKENHKSSSSYMDDDDAAGIQREHEQVLNAAESAGFPRTDAVRAKLLNLYAENGLEKMLAGINACVDYGVTTIAYLTAVLKGEPKKAKQAGKTVAAQQYSQRDYSDEDQEAFRRMMNDAMKAELEAEERKTG